MIESNQQQEARRPRRRGRKSDDGVAPNRPESTTKDAASSPSHASLLISPLAEGELWYTCGPISPERNAVFLPGSTQQNAPNPMSVVLKYRQQADQIYRNEIQIFNSQQKLSSDDQWVETTMRKGTLKDRIAAMSVVISTNPIHKFHTLDSLLSMAGCQATSPSAATSRKPGSSSASAPNSRVIQMAAEALEDLFIHTLLPSDRKLYTLSQRPLMLYESTNQVDSLSHDAPSSASKKKKKKSGAAPTKRTLSPRILLLWRFEEMVKERYDWFLRQYISRTLNDSILHTGSASTSTSTASSNMDGPKIAALRTASALMRSVPEGETFLLPLLVNKLGDPKATICAGTSYELRKVLHVHPAMTDIVAREVQQLVHRPHLSMHAMYNCITFLNQLKLSRPNPPSKDESIKNKEPPNLAVSLMNTYFRLFDVAMIQQKQKSNTSHPSDSGDTNYQTRLLSALLTGVNRAHPYVPSSNKDGNGSVASLIEHVDSLYRVVHTASPAAKTQSLLLLFHVAVGSTGADAEGKKKKNADSASDLNAAAQRDRFYRALYATLSDPAMIGTGKHLTMYFNLLFKALKYETDMSRLLAFAKRLWSTALHCSSPVLAATVFLLDAIAYEHHPILFTSYRDVLSGRDSMRTLDPTKREPRGAFVVFEDDKEAVESDAAHGDEIRAPGWEYSLTMHHYHPSVQKFTAIFGNGENIHDKYSGDPLRDFALAPFLDKFAYRNPKSIDRKSEDDADPSGKKLGIGARRRAIEKNQQPLNDPSFIEQSAVHPHEEFFHKFFVERANRDAIKGIVRNKGREDQDMLDAAESEAFDRIESRNADQNMLDNYDNWDQWDTDDEEEAFVDSLAQQIIDDAMEGNAVDDLDAEDPDTEGWDDLHEDKEDNRDVFVLVDQADDDISESSPREPSDEEEFDDDGDLENGDSDALDDGNDDGFVDSDEDDIADLVDDEDSDEDAFAALVDDNDSDDDDEAPVLVPVRPANAKNVSGDVFAAAEDYSEVIENSWRSQKRQHSGSLDDTNDDDDDDGIMSSSQVASTSKRKKRNRRK